MKSHSGIGVKALKFQVPTLSVYNEDSHHLDQLDSLLLIAVKPGIEELSLILTVMERPTSRAHFYLVELETNFGIFSLRLVNSIRQLDLVALEA